MFFLKKADKLINYVTQVFNIEENDRQRNLKNVLLL